MLFEQIRMSHDHNVVGNPGHRRYRPVKQSFSSHNEQLLGNRFTQSGPRSASHDDCDNIHSLRLPTFLTSDR